MPATVTAANIIAGVTGQFLVQGTSVASSMNKGKSLNGQWSLPTEVSDHHSPYAADILGRIYMASVKGGKAYTTIFERGEGFAQVREPVQITNISMGDTVKSVVLAGHEVTKKLYAVVQTTGAIYLYESPDNGATWQWRNIMYALEGSAIVTLHDAAVHCDETTQRLMVTGFHDGTYQGARGKLEVHHFGLPLGDPIEWRGIAHSLPLVHQIVVGPSDGGRAGIIRRPGTMELVAVVAKLQAGWTTLPGETRKGIVEYKSVDSGATWTLAGFHPVT